MASGLTPNYNIPYPLSSDPVDVHGDMYDLADRIDDVLLTKADLGNPNTFTSTNIFSVNSANTAVRITQLGAGEAFRVEDSTNPDATAFVIDASGDTTLGKDLIFRGSTSGTITLTATAIAGTNTLTLPALTGTLAINPTTTIGDIIYASATGTPGTLTRLAGNTSATRSFLGQTGTGSASAAPSWTSSTGTGNVVLASSPTITTPVIDTINISAAGTSGALWNTTITTGSISIGGSLTTGGINLATGTAFNGTVAIATGAGTVNKTVNIGTSSTSGTTAITIGSSSGATSTIALNGTVTVGGDMTINGTLTTINSNSLTIDDKNIELGSVTAGTVSTTGTVGSITGTGPWTATITGMTDTADLVAGSAISATNGTGSLGSGGTYIVASIVSNTSITYTATGGTTPTAGTVTNIATTGATDITANGGGVILKGTTDKTILWDSTNTNWTSSENFNLVSGKVYKINNVQVLSSTALTMDTITASGASATGSLWSNITTGSIGVGAGLTTGGYSIANGTAFNGTVNIASGAGTVNKTINIGTASTSGTTAITIGSAGGATSTIALNGTATASTAAADTNTTQLATTAFVIGQASSTNPTALGSVAIGTSLKYARADHVHPTTGLALLAGATFTGQIQSTLANNTADGGGQIYLNGATGNRIDFNINGVAAPTFTTRSTGTKIVLYPVVSASSVDYAIGIESGALWQSVGTSSNSFKWYAGTTNIASLSGGGQLTASSFIPSSSTVPTNGMYLSAANTVNFATNTTADRLVLTSGGSVNINSTSTTLGSASATQQFGVVSSSATNVGVVIRGASAQTGNLLELQDSAGTNVIFAKVNGSINARYYDSIAASGTYIDTNLVTNSFVIVGRSTTAVTLITRPVASQTADLIQYQDATGSAVTSGITSAGYGYFGTTHLGGTFSIFPIATNRGLVIRANSSQSVDLQQWQNSGTTVVTNVDKDGILSTTNTASSGNQVTNKTYVDNAIAAAASTTEDIVPLDDISNYFDGTETRFAPTYQGQLVSILNPLRLLLTINGIIQYVDSPEYVWLSGVPRRGFFVDSDGYLQFSESVPAGSDFDARVMSGSSTTTKTRVYPFKPLDILLGG